MKRLSAAILVIVVSAAQLSLAGIDSYPYVAKPERRKQIVEGYKKVIAGMTAAEVRAILGDPDNVLPLYEPKVKYANRIGTTQWYFIEIRAKDRTTDAKLVRVSLDLDGKVIQVDHWGFDEPAPKNEND